MNRPEFSIVTVCFNSEKTISKTIESVLAQRCKDYEYIIVDGASKDGTLNIIKTYEPQFEGRLICISEPDKGIYDAFNKGVKRASGKYIWLVNSDDYIEVNALEQLFIITKKYTNEDAPIISAAMNFIDDNSCKIMKSSAKLAQNAFKEDAMGIVHPATLIPKRIYERVGYYDDFYKIIGDIDWFHRAYLMNMEMLFIDNVITNMMSGGISTQYNFEKSYRDRKYYLKKHYKNLFLRSIRFLNWFFRFYKRKLRSMH